MLSSGLAYGELGTEQRGDALFSASKPAGRGLRRTVGGRAAASRCCGFQEGGDVLEKVSVEGLQQRAKSRVVAAELGWAQFDLVVFGWYR